MSISQIWTLPHFQQVYKPFKFCDIVLHSVHKICTCAWISLYSLLVQQPYKCLYPLTCTSFKKKKKTEFTPQNFKLLRLHSAGKKSSLNNSNDSCLAGWYLNLMSTENKQGTLPQHHKHMRFHYKMGIFGPITNTLLETPAGYSNPQSCSN